MYTGDGAQSLELQNFILFSLANPTATMDFQYGLLFKWTIEIGVKDGNLQTFSTLTEVFGLFK